MGTREQAQSLNYGHCSFATCTERTKEIPCALNSINVDIAIGLPVADLRVDTQIQSYTVDMVTCQHRLGIHAGKSIRMFYKYSREIAKQELLLTVTPEPEEVKKQIFTTKPSSTSRLGNPKRYVSNSRL